jgi:methyl-accepting chemotaxis protein WspA
MVQSYEPGKSFYEVVFDQLIPALNEADESATNDSFQQLEGYYSQHQEAIVQLLAEIEKEKSAREVEVTSIIRSTTLSMLALLIALPALIGAWFFFTGRSVLRTLGGEPATIKGVVRELAKGDLSVQLTVRQNDTDSVVASIAQMREQIGALVQDIQRAGVQVTSSSTQLAASAKGLQDSINETVASTHEVTAASKQISATRGVLQSTMSDVATLTNQTAQAAGEGQSGLARMTGTMEAMEVASRDIGQKLAAINEKVTNITTVVTTITKIADQTNLLSLNASIEAAKAGEYGRGFSVVAREIRRLADQTAVATLDIEKMVNDMQSSVSSGVMGMEKFARDVQGTVSEVTTIGAQMTHIIAQIQSLSPRIESVNQGMEQQSVGANQITDAMTQLGAVTMNSVESQHQLDQVTAGLQAAAAELQRSVQRFVLAR